MKNKFKKEEAPDGASVSQVPAKKIGLD